MKKQQSWFQQGDVVIRPCAAVLPGFVRVEGRLVLAEGEVTGHCHEVTTGDAILYRNAEALILEVLSAEATVTHQTHGPQVLPRGLYAVEIVKEYDHFAEEAKKVAD